MSPRPHQRPHQHQLPAPAPAPAPVPTAVPNIPEPEPETGIVEVADWAPPPAYTGAMEADQTLVFPIQSKRSAVAPNVEGSYIVRTVDKWVFMPLFQFDSEGNLRQGVAHSYQGQR